jgi:hypothetical protein
MKPITVLALMLLLQLAGLRGVVEAREEEPLLTDNLAVPEGWLQSPPSRELVLDVRQEGLEYGARRDACEFLTTLINKLLGAGYTIHLSDDFIQREIKYYRENLNREKPVEMSKAILGCLEEARTSGALDWDCFKRNFSQSTQMTSPERERHLPWLGPPSKTKLLYIAGATNLPTLHLWLDWTGRSYHGAVLYSRGPATFPGESVVLQGKDKLWAFSAVMRFTKGSETVFDKAYLPEKWQSSYATHAEQPLFKISQAVLEDVAIGLHPKPIPPADTGSKKSRKRSKTTSDPSSPP